MIDVACAIDRSDGLLLVGVICVFYSKVVVSYCIMLCQICSFVFVTFDFRLSTFNFPPFFLEISGTSSDAIGKKRPHSVALELKSSNWITPFLYRDFR